MYLKFQHKIFVIQMQVVTGYDDTWSCSGGPQPGDIITIEVGDIVTISQSVDLTMGGETTDIVIKEYGFLEFNPPPCNGIACKLDLKLASGSVITVDGLNGIFLGPNAIPGQTRVYIGDDVVLHANGNNGFPFGPGMLQDLAPLPVELSAFLGVAMDRSNMLKWQTESEENTMVFLVRAFIGR